MSSLLDAYRLLKEGTQQTTGDTSMPQNGPDKDVCPKCGKKKCECEDVSEELKGKQKKLDKNHNGQLDSQDFAILRNKKKTNEDTVPFDGPYTSTFKKAKNPNRTGMDAARALSHKFLQKSKKTGVIVGHEKYSSSSDKLKPQHFGTQVKEEVEQLEEANHRDFASAGMMHPDMAKHMNVGDHMDYYEPKTGDKVHGKVMHKSDKEVHMKQTHDSYDPKKVGSVHKFKIGTQLPENMKEEVEQVQEVLTVSMGISKWIHDFVHSTNPKFKGKSVKERQKMALGAFYAAKKGVKEGVELVYELKKATLASYVKKAGHSIERHAGDEREADLADWDDDSERKEAQRNVQNRHKGIKNAVKRLAKEEFVNLDETVQTTHEDPLITVHDKHGLHTHANLSTANSIFNTKVKHTDVHNGPVQTTSGWKDSNHGVLTFAISQHHSKAMQEEVQLDEGDLSIRTLYNKFADAHVGGGDTKSTEKAIRKVHGDEVFKHMKRAANANAKGDFDGEERHFERAQNAGRRTDRIGSTVGRGRSAFRKQWEEVQVNESGHQISPTVHTQNYTWGKMKTIHHGHDFSIPLHPEHHEAIAKLENDQEHKFKDETGRHWTAKRQGNDVHFDANGLKTTVSHQSMKESWDAGKKKKKTVKEDNMKSFKDFITEMEFVNGRYVHKGKYGTSYDDPEGKEDDEKPAAEKAVKRGRGRPAGSKSGARQIGGASKKGSGVEYTGYKLHLPNSNKSY